MNMNFIVLAASLLLAQPARVETSGRTIELKVTAKGFEPDQVHVKKGEPLKLLVTRTTDQTCAKQLVVKDAGVRKDLPLNQPVTIELTPEKGGEIRYACGMDMVSGVLAVD
jgi:plastocyanin domain-containing protein